MKKIFLLFITALCCLGFISCENGGDVIKGTWKNVVVSSNTASASEMDYTYVFDGKGNFTFINADMGRTSKGTYVIEENNTLVRLHGTTQNEAGDIREYDSELLLDLNETPPTLTAYLYGEYGLMGILIFEKQ